MDKFRSPGLAVARDERGMFHINSQGVSAYTATFLQAFGFYEGLAAVQASDGWLHIRPDGTAAYETVGDLLLVEGQHYLVTHFYFEPLTEAEAQAIRGLGLADPVVFDQWVAKNGVHRPEATPMVLHPDYWDCECERDYIHRKRQGNYCPWCQSHLEDMPDARLHELLDHYVAARDGAVFRESARPVPSGWGNARADNSGTGGGTGRSRRLPPNTK